MRILSSAFLFLLGFAAIFVSYYLPSLDIARTFYNTLPFYAPLAAFCLVISLTVQIKGGRPWILSVFLYVLAATAGEFALREFLKPLYFAKAADNPLPEDFLLNGHPNSKKGVMAETPQGIYIFGEILKTPNKYLGRNFSLITSSNVVESDMIRVEENRILALNMRTISSNTTNTAQGMSTLQLPFSLPSIYSLWGEKNPQNVVLTEAVGKFEVFKNPLLQPYKKAIVLAFARYAGTFLLLLLAAVFGLSAVNTLDFKNMHLLGSLAFFIFGMPALSLIHYYIIEIINAVVNGLL